MGFVYEFIIPGQEELHQVRLSLEELAMYEGAMQAYNAGDIMPGNYHDLLERKGLYDFQGVPLQRKYSMPVVIFKGPGFYVNDSKVAASTAD